MARLYGFSRKQRTYLSLIVLIITLLVGLGQQKGWFGAAKQAAEVNQPGLYTVTRYVDGDTIIVNINGTNETIRFIGADTPETHKPNTPVQCYGPEASAYTKHLISAAGGKVRLASDPYSTNRDRYNRLLRYIYLPDNTLVEESLLRGGYAFYYPYFPFTKSDQFHKDQDQAIAAHQGLWARCKPIASGDGGYKSNTQGT